jgi:hypothetical protein
MISGGEFLVAHFVLQEVDVDHECKRQLAICWSNQNV